MLFDKKVVVITGGNSGIGLVTANYFIKEGAKIAIFGRDKDTLNEAKKTMGSNCHAVQGDVVNVEDLKRLFKETNKIWGGIDVLFANAGISCVSTDIGNMDYDTIRRIIDINLMGTIYTVKEAVPYLNNGSSIILNSSVSTVRAVSGQSVYSASKAALEAFARGAVSDFAPRGIRINTIRTGYINTKIWERCGLPSDMAELVRDFVKKDIPMNRIGEPEELAKTVAFLASDNSSFINGAVINVDGGQTSCQAVSEEFNE